MLALTQVTGHKIIVTHGGETLSILVGKTKGKRTKLYMHGPRTFEIVREEASRQTGATAGSVDAGLGSPKKTSTTLTD